MSAVPGVPALVALLALALLLAGCTERDLAVPETLRIGLYGAPSGLDPHLQAELAARSVLANIYEPLVAFDPHMALVPALAESWHNPSDHLWRFRLRPGVRFHDDRPLEVADAVAALERARSHPRSRQKGALLGVVAVRAVDERTLEVETDEPNPLLLTRLASVFVTPRDAPETIERPVGTGPFRFVAGSAERVELVRVPDHWRRRAAAATGEGRAAREGPHAGPTTVEYRFVGDQRERVQGLLAGRFDLVDDLDPEHLSTIETAPSARVEHMPSLGVTYLQMDPGEPPFDDPRVRRAIALAIDRRALVEQVHGGHAEPVAQMASREVFGFDPTLRPAGPDRQRARALLAEAGHGVGMTLVLETREGLDVGALRNQLEEVGIRLEVDSRPWSEMVGRLATREVRFYLGTWSSPSGDAGEALERKIHTWRPGSRLGDANPTAYSNPRLDALVAESRGLVDMEERRQVLQRALRLAAEDHVFVPLFSRHDLYGVAAGVPWQPRQDGGVYAFEVGS